ncbi:hypothetical protein AGMMS50289_01220 [Betaproteobacteria bacterium]|nr:hypothetical protein AGMMS50289_01220 [Betaproteobacteria bacterium]
MKGLFRRPLVVALAFAFGVASVYGIWLIWQMRQLGRNGDVAPFSPPAPPSASSSALLSIKTAPVAPPEPTPIAVHKPVAAPRPAHIIEDESVAEAPAEEPGIVFVAHTRSEATFTPLQAAYAALTTGDVETARQQFVTLLKEDPRHLEALLGLAAIAERENEPEAAWRFYQSAWTAHPQDARVQTGMLAWLSAAGQLDPQRLERRLKNLIAAQPEAAAPHFALGNLFAGEARWPEAQAAYFEACRLDTGNPDYRFNLAVSLDALHQSRLAATHYQAALDAAESAPANFTTDEVRSRLQALQDKDAP